MLLNPIHQKTFPNVYDGYQYALDVVEGRIVSCVYVKGACQRFLNDYSNFDAPFYFDPEKAEKYLRLVQRFKHVIGTWDTAEIIYQPWQKFIWMNIIGFISTVTKCRRFRIAHIEVARGNAKSAMASQAVLFMLALDDNIQGNQISCVATKRDQAKIVLGSAMAMAKKSPTFLFEKGVKVMAHTIEQKDTNSKAYTLASRDDSLDGLNDVLAVLDELHAMDREVFDVIYSGMSKRKDSLTLCITTAGFNMDSVGFSQSEYAKQVCEGKTSDEQMFAIVYTLDEEDIKNDKNIFNPEVWIKANPNYGVSVDPTTFAAKSAKAKHSAADLPNFKVKHLNIWISEGKAFFDVNKWRVLGQPELKLEDFKGAKGRVGIDVASKIDLCSLGYVFKREDKYCLFDRSYIPESRVTQLRSSLYDNCISSGHLLTHPGDAIDQELIEKQVLEDSKDFKLLEVLYDPWNAIQMGQNLQKKRLPVTEFRMTVQNLSEATKTLDALIRQGRVIHNGSPLLQWCLGNIVCKFDAADNVFPRKNHERLKIDPIIAILMALASLLQDEKTNSVYESRGIRFM